MDYKYELAFCTKNSKIKNKICLSEDGNLPHCFTNYLFSSNQNMTDICKPLSYIKTDYFLYVKTFKDGSHIELTTNAGWSEVFYKHKYYEIDVFGETSNNKQSGIFLWSALPCQKIFTVKRELFSINSGITLATTSKNISEFYHFGSKTQSAIATNFYLNNIDLIKHFIFYFKDKATSLIRSLESKRIHILRGSQPLSTFSDLERRNFLQKTTIDRYYFDPDVPNKHLTRREVECLNWFIYGKTAAETAMLLNITKRTVEAHLENIKLKLNCFKQGSLGYKYANLFFVKNLH